MKRLFRVTIEIEVSAESGETAKSAVEHALAQYCPGYDGIPEFCEVESDDTDLDDVDDIADDIDPDAWTTKLIR